MKANTLRLLILILSSVLIVALSFAIRIGTCENTSAPDTSLPQTSVSPPWTQFVSSSSVQPSAAQTSTAATESTSSTAATESTPPPTVSQPPATAGSTSAGGEYIGSLYTRDQLEAMDSKHNGYGAGKEVDSKNRPLFAQRIDKEFEKYDAHFICPDDGKVYLTYNCTYEHEGLVQKTLDILKEKNVQCVIFIDKAFAKYYPQLVQQIIADGHILANHCTTHPDLPTLSIDKIVDQIMNVHNYVKDTFGYEMKLFRPPSGYYSEQVWAIAQSLGYRSYNWSFTYRDWDTDDQSDPDSVLDEMMHAIHSGAIYQLHAISATNVAVLPDFIDSVREAGYEFALLP